MTAPARPSPIIRLLPRLRWAVQAGYALFLVLVGFEFARFFAQAAAGQTPTASRPPAVEAFLPISALVGLKRWLLTGRWDEIHPAGLAILCGALLGALLARKALCSWVCPIGTLSRGVEWVGRKLLWRRGWPAPPRPLALALTVPKYLILAFFLWAVVFAMPLSAAESFLASPYNLVADAKMLLLFLEPTALTLGVLAALALLSLVLKHFWCRVLCPYGALLGVFSVLSPQRVDRDEATCTDCQACTRACPVDIPVHARRQVVSAECTGCLSCVAACPVKGTLGVALPVTRRRLPAWLVPAVGVGALLAVWLAARLSGHWETSIPVKMLVHLYQQVRMF